MGAADPGGWLHRWEEEGHPVTGDLDHPFPTKEAADAAARELAMELIDSQCEHDYQLESVGGVYLRGAYVCRPFAATE